MESCSQSVSISEFREIHSKWLSQWMDSIADGMFAGSPTIRFAVTDPASKSLPFGKKLVFH